MTYETPIGANMFAYCGNNPVMRADHSGSFWTIFAGAVIGAAISGGIELGMQIASGEKIDLLDVGIASAAGAASGALAATSGGYIAQVAGNAAISFLAEGASQLKNGNRNISSILTSSCKMAAVGAASVVIGGKGIRAKGSPYRKSLDTLSGLKDDVGKAFSNPSGYKDEILAAISNHQTITDSALKETAIRFGGASLFSNIFGSLGN
jgi:hypothetical protein